jgi:hypothetical protein
MGVTGGGPMPGCTAPPAGGWRVGVPRPAARGAGAGAGAVAAPWQRGAGQDACAVARAGARGLPRPAAAGRSVDHWPVGRKTCARLGRAFRAAPALRRGTVRGRPRRCHGRGLGPQTTAPLGPRPGPVALGPPARGARRRRAVRRPRWIALHGIDQRGAGVAAATLAAQQAAARRQRLQCRRRVRRAQGAGPPLRAAPGART